MEHRLVSAVEDALNWKGPAQMGQGFARGTITDTTLTERLLTPTKLLDLAMRRSLANPQVRVFQNGEELHPRGYLSPVVNRRGQSVSLVNMVALGNLLNAGATMVLDQANVFDPTLEVACRAMQWWSRERVQVNIYLTTQDAAGFDLHFDDHDVVVLQLGGEKDWEVRGASRIAPMFRDAARNDTPSEEPVWAGTLRAGEVMHIPRGYWHRATRNGMAEGGYSLHMTLGFEKRTAVHWLNWLADWSREREVFRHDLDRWGSDQDQRAQAEELAEAAANLIRSRGPAAYLAAREQETITPRHVPHLDITGPLTAVVCATEFPPRIRETDEGVVVEAAGKRFTFHPKALPFLRPLLSGHPFPLDHASADPVLTRVADVLTREGLCVPLTPELSSGYTGLVTNAAP